MGHIKTQKRWGRQGAMIGMLLIAVLFLILSGCSSTTSTTKGSLSGTIALVNDTRNTGLDPRDNAGITVALYHAVALDSTIVRLNNSNPNLGVQISQTTDFDHRLQSAAALTTTAADGSFSMTGLRVGTYNLVAYKEGWGVRYVCDIDIAEGDNTLPATRGRSDLELYPVTELSGYNGTAVNFLSNHDYLITDDLSLTGSATFNPGARLWIYPGKSLEFYGSVTTPADNPDLIKITSSDAMYSTVQHTPEAIQKFYKVNCTSYSSYAGNLISSILTTFTETGWSISVPQLVIRNLIIRYMKTGLVFNQLSSINITKSIIRNSTDFDLGGISLTACTDFNTTNLIFKDCTTGIRQHSSSNVNVTNCYFNNCSITSNEDLLASTQGCVNNLYETTGSVINCTFENSVKGISTSGRSTTLIQYCVFKTTVGIHNYHQLNWFYSHFTANYNNFYCSQYNAATTAVFNQTNLEHMDAKNNYWGTTNTSIIDQKLYDYNDLPAPDPNHPDYTIWAIIDYTPFSPHSIATAGITSN
jgi:hypothetical protein